MSSNPLLAVLGFAIAFAIGLTGAGGGSLAMPALVLLGGLPVEPAIGTALAFSALLKLCAAPWFWRAGRVDTRALRLLLAGALPGLAIGAWALAWVARAAWTSAILAATGMLVLFSAALTLRSARRNGAAVRDRTRWLPWLALPLGAEIGFSAVGSGALGTALLLHCTPVEPAVVVGTDLCFGIAATGVGALFHWRLGSVHGGALMALLVGGLPGLWLGGRACTRLPPRQVRTALALILLVAGAQLCWAGWTRRQTPELATGQECCAAVEAPGNRVANPHWASLAVERTARRLRARCP